MTATAREPTPDLLSPAFWVDIDLTRCARQVGERIRAG
jgi:hypothetical protein